MSITAKEAYYKIKSLLPEEDVLTKIFESSGFLYIRKDCDYNTFTIKSNFLASIVWPDGTKSFPIKESEKENGIVEWLEGLKVTDRFMTCGNKGYWCECTLSHIQKYTGHKQVYRLYHCISKEGFMLLNLAPYNIEFIGTDKEPPFSLKSCEIKDIPEELLRGIPGNFYRGVDK